MNDLDPNQRGIPSRVMRPSSYLFVAEDEDDGSGIVCNLMEGHLDRIGARTAGCLRSTITFDVCLRQGGISPAELRFLRDRGYVTERTPDEERALFIEKATRLHEESVRRASPVFVIIPSYRCNLQCVYCYQPEVLHHSMDVMSRRLADAAVKAIVGSFRQRNRPTENAYLKLCGGEPLLQQNRPCVERLVRVLGCEHGFYIKAVTNGTELEQYADLLGPRQIAHVQVTLDGPAAVHDRRRVGVGFPRTFELIARNITLALERDIRVDVRVNVDRLNVSSVGPLGEEVERRGWASNGRFTLYLTEVTPSEHRPKVSATLLGADTLFDLSEACTTAEAAPFSADSVVDIAVSEYARTGRLSTIRTSYCGANTGQYVLDPYGRIYVCDNDAGNPTKSVGSFRSGRLAVEEGARRLWTGRHVGAIADCCDCSLALLCGGGCAYCAAVTKGSHYEAYCNGFKEHALRRLPAAFKKHFGQYDTHGNERPPHDGLRTGSARVS